MLLVSAYYHALDVFAVACVASSKFAMRVRVVENIDEPEVIASEQG